MSSAMHSTSTEARLTWRAAWIRPQRRLPRRVATYVRATVLAMALVLAWVTMMGFPYAGEGELLSDVDIGGDDGVLFAPGLALGIGGGVDNPNVHPTSTDVELHAQSSAAPPPASTSHSFSAASRTRSIVRRVEFPPTLVTTKGPGGADTYEHTTPYMGFAHHITTTVGPVKDYHAGGATASLDLVLTSLWFFEGKESFPPGYVQQVVASEAMEASFECVYRRTTDDDGVDDDESEHQRDEAVTGRPEWSVRSEYVTVDCDLPSWLRSSYVDEASTPPERERRWRTLRGIKDIEVTLNVYLPGLDHPFVSHRIPSDSHSWDTPSDAGYDASICVAPLRLEPATPMSDILEWRLFHAYQGIGRVHWYARTTDVVSWVERLNGMLGLNDTWTHTPYLSGQRSPAGLYHADQAVWYQDCLMRYGLEDDWLAMVDIDEFIYVLDDTAPLAVRNYLVGHNDQEQGHSMPVGWGASRASEVVMYQTYVGGARLVDLPEVDGYAHFPRNAYAQWQPAYVLAGGRYTKSIHRAAAVRQLWVHFAILRGSGWGGVEGDPLFLDPAQESDDTDPSGLLHVVHSRHSPYPDIEFIDHPRADTPAWRTHWAELAEDLKGLESLHWLS